MGMGLKRLGDRQKFAWKWLWIVLLTFLADIAVIEPLVFGLHFAAEWLSPELGGAFDRFRSLRTAP